MSIRLHISGRIIFPGHGNNDCYLSNYSKDKKKRRKERKQIRKGKENILLNSIF
jgi:hypothetical protein